MDVTTRQAGDKQHLGHTSKAQHPAFAKIYQNV